VKLKIESGFPMPIGRRKSYGILHDLREAISVLKPGESFLFESDNRYPYLVSKQLGVIVKTEKQSKGGWRLWRVK